MQLRRTCISGAPGRHTPAVFSRKLAVTRSTPLLTTPPCAWQAVKESRDTIEPHALHALGRPASSLLIYLQHRLLVTQSCLAPAFCLSPLQRWLAATGPSTPQQRLRSKAGTRDRHCCAEGLWRERVRTCYKRTRLTGSVERVYLSSSGRGACVGSGPRIWQIYRWRQCRSSSQCSLSTGHRRLCRVSATFYRVLALYTLSGHGPRRQPVLVEPLAVPWPDSLWCAAQLGRRARLCAAAAGRCSCTPRCLPALHLVLRAARRPRETSCECAHVQSFTAHVLCAQGAQNVRCARCGQITPVPPAGGPPLASCVQNTFPRSCKRPVFCLTG